MLHWSHACFPSPYLCAVLSGVTVLTLRFISTCLLHVKVWTAHVCSVTDALHIHAHISQNGCTALHLAAQGGHEDVVELLLEAKADPELKEKVINL